MPADLKIILDQFELEGAFAQVVPVKTGHINESYRVEMQDPGHNGYFLQSVNYHIFKDVPALMTNIQRVLQHLKSKADKQANGFSLLELVPAKDQQYFYLSGSGDYWRVYKFLPGCRSYDLIQSPHVAYEAGKAFGQFIADLSDLDASLLTDTIPNFHNVETRLQTFWDTVRRDPERRKDSVKAEIDFVSARQAGMIGLFRKVQSGEIPTRITHNDTKINNVMFNAQDRAFCIVDLDTVMPGSILYDFGDAIRTGANTANEDEPDLAKVDINLELFENYTKGFLEKTGKALTQTEIGHLAFSCRYLTFVIGLRFLTDHIDGDRYFRIQRPNHNLERARVQFRLVEQMEKRKAEMEAIVNRYVK